MSSDEDSDLKGAAERALAKLVPALSKEKYEKTYEKFKKWCSEKKVKTINESKLIAYFDDEFANYKASTTWSAYSMLKSTLSVKDNIDIGKFNFSAEMKNRCGNEKPVRKKLTFQHPNE